MRSTERVILGKSLREHIGGRWAISLWMFAIGFPFNVAAIAANVGESSAPWQWLGIGVASYLALGLVWWLASLTLFRARAASPVPIWWTVTLGALSGGVRGAVAAALATGLLLSPASGGLFATRVLTGAVLGALLMPIGALVLSCVATYRTQRHRLVDEAVSLRVQQMQLDGASDALRASILDSVSTQVRSLDAHTVRAASHELWSSEEAVDALPRLRWQHVVWASIAHSPFPTLPVVLVWLLSAWGSLAASIGWPRALAQMAFSVAAIASGFALGRLWSRRAPAQSLLAFLVIMIAVVLLTGPVASWLFDPRPFGAGVGLIVVNALWLPLLTILISICITAARSGEDVLAQLQDSVDSAAVSTAAARVESERVRREVATQLHGSVQSRLLAVAARNAQPDLLRGDENAAVHDALAALQTPAGTTSLRFAIASVCEPWAGLMEVTYDVATDVAGPAVERARQIVEEALTNAYRHGHASQVTVSVQSVAGALEVSVTDDGGGPGDAGSGLGTAVIAAASDGNWSLSPGPNGGSVLLATVSGA